MGGSCKTWGQKRGRIVGREAMNVAPERAVGYGELAQLYLGANRNLPDARGLAETAAQLEPTAANYYVLSWACDKNGDVESALEAMRQAIELAPANEKYKRMYETLKKKR